MYICMYYACRIICLLTSSIYFYTYIYIVAVYYVLLLIKQKTKFIRIIQNTFFRNMFPPLLKIPLFGSPIAYFCHKIT